MHRKFGRPSGSTTGSATDRDNPCTKQRTANNNRRLRRKKKKNGTSLTGAEIHPRQQTSHPSRFAFAFPEVRDERAKEYAERVRDSVHHHVAHEAGEHDHPAVSAVRRRRQIVVLAERNAVVVGVLYGPHGQGRGAGVLSARLVGPIGGRTFALGLWGKKKNEKKTYE